jgi:hypothetical protein
MLISVHSWQALWLGRKSFMSLSDLSCPLPKDQSLAGPFRQLAAIVEESVRTIYTPRQKNLREIYDDAEKINEALQQFSSQHSIGDVNPPSDKLHNQVGLVVLHNSKTQLRDHGNPHLITSQCIIIRFFSRSDPLLSLNLKETS